QGLGEGVRPYGRVRLGCRKQRPASGSGRGAEPRWNARARVASPVAASARRRPDGAMRPAAPGERPQRSDRVVGDPAGPDEIPESGDELVVVRGADGVGELAKEVAAARPERVE